jgi:hypothetical protein
MIPKRQVPVRPVPRPSFKISFINGFYSIYEGDMDAEEKKYEETGSDRSGCQ